MNILALHTDFRIYWPARLKALNRALNKRGDTLDVVEIAGEGSPYAFSKREGDISLNWHILFPKEKPENLAGKQIEERLYPLLDRINPDVIIAGAIAFSSGALAVNWGIIHNKRVIVFDDAKIETVKRSPIVDFIKQAVYNGVDALLYPAPEWIETGKYWKFRPEQLFYGIDVVDNNFWGNPQHLNCQWDRFFLAVGRQIPKKNFLTIVKSYCRYASRIGTDAYDLVLIGDGPDHKSIVDLANRSGLSDKIFFLPFLPQEDLSTMYSNSQALIVCSIEETWGLVINEAMASGCPVIASVQSGATNTLVQEGVNGYKFSCEDEENLTEIMIRFHNLPFQHKELMRQEAKRIISKWGLEYFVQSCCQAIDYVVSGPKRKITILDRIIIKLWKGRYRPI